MRLKANKSFYSDGRIEPKRIVKRGEEFDTDETHAAELQRRNIAFPLDSIQTSVVGPKEIKEKDLTAVLPDEIKEIIDDEPTEEDHSFHLHNEEELHGHTVAELRQIAKQLNLTGYSNMTKHELIAAILANYNEEGDV